MISEKEQRTLNEKWSRLIAGAVCPAAGVRLAKRAGAENDRVIKSAIAINPSCKEKLRKGGISHV